MKYYAGIGSRKTPANLNLLIKEITKKLAEAGYILRSGGADGADKYFEQGCDLVSGQKEIYLPWKNFNGNKSVLYNITKSAEEMAKKFHPNGDNLKDTTLKLMSRNCYQVLGFNLKTPADFVICWTEDGKDSGGTGQALRIARHHNIPVYNLYHKNDIYRLFKLIGS